jgi:putative membrane protein
MRLSAIAAVLILAGPPMTSALEAQANPPIPPGQAATPRDAHAYLRMANSGDLYEIQSSQLALQNSQEPSVKNLAQMIIADHTRLSAELKQAAKEAGVAVAPPMLAPHHAQMLERLRAAPAARFDALYRQQQVTAHREALNLHRNYAASGDVAALKVAASRAVPAIEMHLHQLQNSPGGGAGSPHDPRTSPQSTPD